MSQQPLFWYRPRSDGGYEGPLHNGQIEDIRKASGAWVPLFAGAAPVNAEPSDDEIIDIAVEPLGIDCVRMPYGVVVFARALLSRYSSAPVVTQPDVTQQTLDDVMAGIPARDAEIEALRKEIETLRAQQDTDRANALPPLNDDLIAILGRPNFLCAQLADRLRSEGQEIAKRAENEQAAVIHFLLGHYLADPVQWAEKASAALKAARKEPDQ